MNRPMGTGRYSRPQGQARRRTEPRVRRRGSNGSSHPPERAHLALAGRVHLCHSRDRERQGRRAHQDRSAACSPSTTCPRPMPTVRGLERIALTVRRGRSSPWWAAPAAARTLLRLIAGLDRPSEGAITLDGETIAGPHPGVGLVFQEPRLLPWLDVAANVGFGLSELKRGERRARVMHALERVGLAEHAGRGPATCRVASSSASRSPAPSWPSPASCSSTSRSRRSTPSPARICTAICSPSGPSTRPTVVLVTHDVGEAVALADRAVVMRPRPAAWMRPSASACPARAIRPRRRARRGAFDPRGPRPLAEAAPAGPTARDERQLVVAPFPERFDAPLRPGRARSASGRSDRTGSRRTRR